MEKNLWLIFQILTTKTIKYYNCFHTIYNNGNKIIKRYYTHKPNSGNKYAHNQEITEKYDKIINLEYANVERLLNIKLKHTFFLTYWETVILVIISAIIYVIMQLLFIGGWLVLCFVFSKLIGN